MVIQPKVNILLFIMSLSSGIIAKSYISEHSVMSSSMNVNGKEFKHTKKNDNGILSEEFLIDSVPVEQDEYFNTLNSVKLDFMNQVSKDDNKRDLERLSMRHEIQTSLRTKVIQTSLLDLENSLKILERSILQPYLIFDSKGIKSKTDIEIIKNRAESIRKDLKGLLNRHDLVAMHNIEQELDVLIDQVQVCLKKSIQNATRTCDDTKVLKELLTMLES